MPGTIFPSVSESKFTYLWPTILHQNCSLEHRIDGRGAAQRTAQLKNTLTPELPGGTLIRQSYQAPSVGAFSASAPNAVCLVQSTALTVRGQKHSGTL